jgi:hypothetical protein
MQRGVCGREIDAGLGQVGFAGLHIAFALLQILVQGFCLCV